MFKVFLYFVLCVSLCVPAHSETIHLATGEYAPWTGSSLPNQGFFTEILSAVFSRMDVAVDIQFYPWTRAERLVKTGDVFAAFPYVENTERLAHSDFTDPVAMSVGRLFYNKTLHPEGLPYERLDDLKGLRIAGVHGYWYESDFRDAGITADFVAKETQLLDVLLRGRYDLVPMDELQGWTLIKKTMPENETLFGVIDKPMNLDPMRMMVSRTYPNSQELLKDFNQALKSIKTDGTYGEILRRYGLQDIAF